MGSMAVFDQTGASIAPFVVLLVSDLYFIVMVLQNSVNIRVCMGI